MNLKAPPAQAINSHYQQQQNRQHTPQLPPASHNVRLFLFNFLNHLHISRSTKAKCAHRASPSCITGQLCVKKFPPHHGHHHQWKSARLQGFNNIFSFIIFLILKTSAATGVGRRGGDTCLLGTLPTAQCPVPANSERSTQFAPRVAPMVIPRERHCDGSEANGNSDGPTFATGARRGRQQARLD